MVKILVYLVGLAGLAALVDLWGRRFLSRGECGLHKALILRDTCVGRCPPGQRCGALETRPYLFGGRQAAACGCMAARDEPRRLDLPDEDALPPSGRSPERPTAPEREDA